MPKNILQTSAIYKQSDKNLTKTHSNIRPEKKLSIKFEKKINPFYAYLSVQLITAILKKNLIKKFQMFI